MISLYYISMNQENNNTQLNEIPQETTEELNSNIQQNSNDSAKKPGKKGAKILFIAIIIVGGVIIFKTIFSGSIDNSPYKSYERENPTREITDPVLFSSASPRINSLAPDFAAYDTNGNKIVLSSFRNQKPVLIIFWATWCGYCAKELPGLKIFTQRYQDKIQIIAVDSGESKQTIKDYIQEKDINFLIVLDENRKIWNQYLIRGTPSHFLIDKKGKIITLRPGLASLADLEIMLSMISI